MEVGNCRDVNDGSVVEKGKKKGRRKTGHIFVHLENVGCFLLFSPCIRQRHLHFDSQTA